MNVSNMIDEIRENLRTSFLDYLHIPREEIRRQILYGLQKVGRETDIFKKVDTYTTTSASERTWASIKSADYYSFKKVLSVRYGSAIINPIGFHQYDNLKDGTLSLDGEPKYYVDDVNKKFGLYNFSAGVGVIVNFAGIPSISSVSNGASPIEQEYEEDIIGAATYKMILRSDNPQPVLLNEFRGILRDMIPHIQRTKSNTTPTGTVRQHEW